MRGHAPRVLKGVPRRQGDHTCPGRLDWLRGSRTGASAAKPKGIPVYRGTETNELLAKTNEVLEEVRAQLAAIKAELDTIKWGVVVVVALFFIFKLGH
jgi:hypothetical protein